ncbi:extracellular calcium-sensing receptor-like [Denticeps clupeoides]|uniref:extracellular calcium-sensing receptor-like n=1 Tax=Denticeps clupeoides TaxID=299321 RepID=UPI0010A58B5F|nr:extracellular calcium-sensing receptor-like [Denticeps clupeoides]
MCVIVYVWLLGLASGRCWSEAAEASCRLQWTPVSDSLYRDGDIIIGGLFPVHNDAPEPDQMFTQRMSRAPCQSLSFRHYRWLQTMLFAIEEINQNPGLLPNITLGYLAADTCLAERTTLGAALATVTGQEPTAWSSNCSSAPQVPVIVGDARSSASIAVARTLGVFDIPMVSYFASCSCLSDSKKYPYFLRTVPSDTFQAKGMASLLRLLSWTWVGVVSGDDDYGKFGVQLLLEELRGSGVCVAYSEVIPKAHTLWRMKNIVDIIRKSSAKVVVVFAIAPDAQALMEEVKRQNVSDRQWIATEAWVTSGDISDTQHLPLLVGTIGFALRKAQIPGLGPFLSRIKPVGPEEEPFVREFWETLFECSLQVNTSGPPRRSCTGAEKIAEKPSAYSDVSQLRVSYNVYKAVYAIAHAIQDMLSFKQGQRSPDINNITPKQLLYYLKRVNFTTPVGDIITFDKNGDPAASYDIINWHRDAQGTVAFVEVGNYDSNRGSNWEFQMEIKKVVWGGGWQNRVPVSVCSTPCPPGTWKVIQKGKPVCCFDCLPCADGEISNTTGSTDCTRCPEDFWSNAQNTECIPKQVEFLSFQDTMGIILTVLSISGAALTAAVLATFFCHRNTPLVRANNSELSFLLLLSLTLCFLCALAFIGQPVVWSCMLRHTLFGVSFVVCISCVLSKTVVVLVAFRATLPGNNLMRYFGPAQQRLGITFCTLIQVLVCLLWLVLAPPMPSENHERTHSATVVLECAVGSVAAFATLLGYIGLLAAICFLLAFFARKLPDNFNEAKFITFSMIIFCAVWAAFVPAYVSSPGKYAVAVEIFAILASSYGLLLCIFAPKCYIILLQPQKNTKKNMMAK